MENNIQLRFQDARWMKDKDRRATIVGAGSVGSMVAFFLSKQVTYIEIYDRDTIEVHNQGTQLYASSQVGQKKVIALMDILKAFSNCNQPNHTGVYMKDYHWDKDFGIRDTVFSCVDNIQTRKDMFEKWCKNQNRKYFIDVRMSAEYGQLFVVTDNDDRIKAYRNSLEGDFPDNACTYQMTVQCASIMAGYAVQAYNNLCSGIPVVFETYFNGPALLTTHSNEHAADFNTPITNGADGLPADATTEVGTISTDRETIDVSE